jgi:hypothetical protein
MTYRENTIRDIAEILSKECGHCDDCEYCGQTDEKLDCTDLKYAQMIFDAGYRNTDMGFKMEQVKGAMRAMEILKDIKIPELDIKIPKPIGEWKLEDKHDELGRW